ncbi:GGDEF domain-containing protein [Deltaproteobacteria bacterium TL4]
MHRIQLSVSPEDDSSEPNEHPHLTKYVRIINAGRFFYKLKASILRKVLRQGELLTLDANEFLIKEGDTSPAEMFILLEGSLAVMSQNKFILRMDLPGDVVGEMSVISPGPRSADVVTELPSKVIAFSNEAFKVEEMSDEVSVFYLMFSYVLAEKLRLTTAQSLLRKNERVHSNIVPQVALIELNIADRLIIRGAVQTEWPEAETVEYTDPQDIVDNPLERHYDLIIVDPVFPHTYDSNKTAIDSLINILKVHSAPIFVVSSYCNNSLNRLHLVELDIDEFLEKPYSIFDLKHILAKFRTWFYKQKELDHIERAADTDRLTGLANRKRLDEFLEALITTYPDNRKPFSLIISDVDNFKHYNDTHGHQMGDVVLATVAAIFSMQVRKGDLAARFGGEEFVMLLPNCEKKGAIRVAEKLRKALEEEVIPYQEQQPTGNLTATFGVATFPEDATDINMLLKKADDCLYEGKESGRNIVVAAKALNVEDLAETANSASL